MSGRLPLNRAMLLNRLNDVQENLRIVRRHAADAGFLKDPAAIRSARYAFIVLVEAAAAICGRVRARRLGCSPEHYPDCFHRLGVAGMLDADLADRRAAMARLRHLVVHVYGEVDDAQFLQFLLDDLVDVDAYVQAIAATLAEEEPS